MDMVGKLAEELRVNKERIKRLIRDDETIMTRVRTILVREVVELAGKVSASPKALVSELDLYAKRLKAFATKALPEHQKKPLLDLVAKIEEFVDQLKSKQVLFNNDQQKVNYFIKWIQKAVNSTVLQDIDEAEAHLRVAMDQIQAA